MPCHGNYFNNISSYYTQVTPSLLVSCDEVKLQAFSVVFYSAVIVYSSINKHFTYLNKCLFHNINLLNPTGHVVHQQFNSQQLYVLPTLYLCVLYLSENKQRLVPLTA